MAQTILVMGKTGSGKTSAARTLNPNETIIIRVINRTLPFKYANIYKEKSNLFLLPNYDDIIKCLNWANSLSSIKNIVITDATYIIRQEYFKRAKEQGYNKYSEFAIHMQQILKTVQTLRDDLKVFMEYHIESVTSDSGTVEYKPSTIGKLLDNQYNILENVDIVLFAVPIFDDKEVKYGFYTNRTLDRNGAEIPAKSPMGMFDELYIDNDLAYVTQKIDEYYG